MSMEEVIDAQIGVLTLPYMAIPLRLKHRQRNRKKRKIEGEASR